MVHGRAISVANNRRNFCDSGDLGTRPITTNKPEHTYIYITYTKRLYNDLRFNG